MPRATTLSPSRTTRITKPPLILSPAGRNGNGAPPHNGEAEAAALGCVLLAGESGSLPETDALLAQLRPSLFYEERHKLILEGMKKLRLESHAVDTVTLLGQLNRDKAPHDISYISALPDKVPSMLNFGTYLADLRDLALRRWCLIKTTRLGDLAHATELTPDQLKEEFAEIYDQSAQIGASTAPMIQIVTPAEARAFEPEPEDFLIGDGLLTRGMIATIGGEPGVGKSRLATTAAVALARGNSQWMGYEVKTQCNTLILQSENDAIRLKEEFAAVPKDLDNRIKVSSLLSHGLAFDNVEFRRELRRLYDQWPFGLMVLDPWNDISFEEGQKDYKQALLNISAVFRGIRRPPAVLIVAHLRKRGRDDNGKKKSGRELLHELSGSLALGSSSRTVFVIQAATSGLDDDRIIFEVAKANNCAPEYLKGIGVRSAWHRKNGAFERVDSFDWEQYDNPGEPERRAVTEEMVREALSDEPRGLKAASLAKKLKKMHSVGESTVFRAIGEDGYLRHLLRRTGLGTLTLQDP